MTEPTIYLDHHATTPLDRRALDIMLPFFTEEFGNPSSATHARGRRAAMAVSEARCALADLLGCHPSELVFTAGATESNNIAIRGGAGVRHREGRGSHLVTSGLEHKSVSLTVESLVAQGLTATVVAPDERGIIDSDRVVAALRPDTTLVSIIAANSEIGTLQPLEAIGAACRERGILFHTDATQMVGKLPVDVTRLGCDLLSLSAHKFYGPKGVGALYVRQGVRVDPIQSGGGQEEGLRSGTLNVPGIVGLGTVARFAAAEMEAEALRQKTLRDALWDDLRSRIPGVHLNGCIEPRLSGNLNVSFAGVSSPDLIEALEGFALSTGSACRSGETAPPDALVAIGVPPVLALGSLRIGLGRSTSREDLVVLADRLVEVVPRLRERRPETV